MVAGYANTDNVTKIHLVQSSSDVQFAIDDADAPSDGARLHSKLALLVEGLCTDHLHIDSQGIRFERCGWRSRCTCATMCVAGVEM